jgi:hypothetical protein
VNGPLPGDHAFPSFRDFEVIHHYLPTASRMMQSRVRKRGINGKYTYTHTIRKQVAHQTIEAKTQLTHRDYTNLLLQQENQNHFAVYKTRRCFMYKNQYFQLDIYKEPCHKRCKVSERERELRTYTSLRTSLPTTLKHDVMGPRVKIQTKKCAQILRKSFSVD